MREGSKRRRRGQGGRRTMLGSVVGLGALFAALTVGLSASGASAKTRAVRAGAGGAVSIKISRTVVGHVPSGFLGLGTEYWALGKSAGRQPSKVDPVFVQLLRNLEDGQPMVLRLGGGSTDNTWWPVSGAAKPGGVNYNLTPSKLAVMKVIATQANLKLLLGLNLAENSPVLAGAEARAMVKYIGASNIYAFEAGNEPELYGTTNFPWYTLNGVPVPARPAGYDLTNYIADLARYSKKLPAGIPLAGPASNAGKWLGSVSTLINGQPRLKVVTVHRYPLQACYQPVTSPRYPTLANLLSPMATVGQAVAVAPYVIVAHRHHLPLRVDEMNTVSCGKPAHFRFIFAMALWAIDALFADARVGIDGVNIHTWPRAQYRLFAFARAGRRWEGFVAPLYYGLLMFAQAAPPGSQLLNAMSPNQLIRAWATHTADGTVRVALVNDDVASQHMLSIRIAGKSVPASLERLLAPGPYASTGVTIGGQTFGRVTMTGVLAGKSTVSTVTPKAGVYRVSLPPASAALLTLP